MRRRRLYEEAFLVTIGISLLGCVATIGNPFDLEAIGAIKVGESTKSDVRTVFGEPDSVSTRTNWGWESWTYSFSAVQSGGPEDFIPFVRWFLPMRSQVHRRLVTISFRGDKVSSCMFHEDIEISQRYAFGIAPSTENKSGLSPCNQMVKPD